MLTRSHSRRLLAGGAALTAALAVAVPADAAGTLKADYRFQNTRASSVSGLPALTDLGGANRFAVQPVDGTNRTVLTFGAHHGLQLKPTTGLPSDNYSIVLLVKLGNVDGYRRYVDFKHGTDDQGLYDEGGRLYFYGGEDADQVSIRRNAWEQVVLTRSASTKTVVGYVDGVKQITFQDTTNLAVIDATKTLIFFRDNLSGGGTGEDSAGAVARIRLYSAPLTATQVKALDREP